MQVLEITCEPIYHGGQERFILNLIENIDDDGLLIDVLTPYDIGNAVFCDSVKVRGGQVYNLGLPFCPGKSRRILYKEIKDFLSHQKYDVVHIHSGSISALAYASKAARSEGVNKIIVHSHATATKSIKHKVVQLIFGRIIWKNATDFLSCSQEAGEGKYPRQIVKNKLKVIPNGIAIDTFKHNESTRKKMRNENNIPQNDFVIGHVGRFSYEKNHKFLIGLFTEILRCFPDSTLLLVGDGELKGEIVDEVKEKGLDRKVIFTGNVDNVQDYYQVMDVFVLPSLHEGFSYVTLEAQAAGLPCIISAGIPEEVMIGENIVRLDLGDVKNWHLAIKSAREAGIADNTAAIIASGYSVVESSKIIQSVYRNNE